MQSPVLEVRSISRRFGATFALTDVSFDVHRGEILGLIGPNGAGKTTLLEILSGLLSPDAGSVLGRESIFYLPEAVTPYPERRTQEVLCLFANLFGRQRALEPAIGALALSGVLATRIGALSKGYRRRVLLAIGLLAPQPLLVVDEPFDGLDLKQTREVMKLLRGLASGGRTLLLSIHQLADAERLCDRFVLLSDGLVRGAGSLDELRKRVGLDQARLEEVFLALA
jgi:ABC-2 type transport system ATP-binding protein